MQEKRLLKKLAELIERRTWTESDKNEIRGYLGTDEPDADLITTFANNAHGTPEDERISAELDKYLNSLTWSQKTKLIADKNEINKIHVREPEHAEPIDRPTIILFLDVLYNGLNVDKVRELKKVLPPVPFVILTFENDGHFYINNVGTHNPQNNPDNVPYYKGTPLFYWNKILE